MVLRYYNFPMGTYFLALPLSVPNKTASVICVYLRLHHVTLLEPQQWISILFRKKKKEGKKEGRKKRMDGGRERERDRGEREREGEGDRERETERERERETEREKSYLD